jgi:hypothetical protein
LSIRPIALLLEQLPELECGLGMSALVSSEECIPGAHQITLVG